jgi:hypothetical protein
MNKEIKDKWLKALRSGEYKQGQGFLREKEDDNSNKFNYCCLGVLVNEVLEEEWDSPCVFNPIFNVTNGIDANSLSSMELIPEQIALDKLSITIEQQKILADKNDSGWTFEDIADWIEKNL